MKVNIQNDLKVSIKSTTSDKFYYSIQTGSEKDLLVETSKGEKEITLKRANSGGFNSGSVNVINTNNSTIIINGVHITGNFSGSLSIGGQDPIKMTLFVPISESTISVESSGCSEVDLCLADFSLEQLNLNASGSSVLSTSSSNELNINSVTVNTSGSADLEMGGPLKSSVLLINSTGSSSIVLTKSKIGQLQLNSTGSSSIDGGKSHAERALAKASGSSSICGFIVSDSLNSKVSGAASISIKELRI